MQVLYCIVLYCVVLYCDALFCICIVFRYCVILFCVVCVVLMAGACLDCMLPGVQVTTGLGFFQCLSQLCDSEDCDSLL